MTLIRSLAALAAVFSLTAAAAPAPEQIRSGLDYESLAAGKPVAVAGKKVKVVELFMYQCPSCAEVETGLETWKKALPADVELERQPAVYGEHWKPAARLYYTLSRMGLLSTLHGKVFEAYRSKDLDLGDREALDAWLAKQGVSVQRFEQIYASKEVDSAVDAAFKKTREVNQNGTPIFVVDDKYATSIGIAGSKRHMLEVVDLLIAKAREERKIH